MYRIAVNQSNYIPWKGYFDFISAVDEFILFDDMQYTRRDWRNRNLIKTPQGVQWLTIPVKVKGKYYQTIRSTEIDDPKWGQRHYKMLVQNYRRAKYFNEIIKILEPIYLNESFIKLSDLNRVFIDTICRYLDIHTKISDSCDYKLIDGKTERLVSLCIQAKATEYISGSAAKNYIDTKLFSQNNIKLTWFDYTGYLEYPQQWGQFKHEVSILDLLFNCGKSSKKYMKCYSNESSIF